MSEGFEIDEKFTNGLWTLRKVQFLRAVGLQATGPAKADLVRDCIHQKEIEKWSIGFWKKPKLRLYRTLKANFGREEYLKLPSDQRSLVAAMRCGNNLESTWGDDVKRKYKIGSVLSAAQARWRTRSISSLIALLTMISEWC